MKFRKKQQNSHKIPIAFFVAIEAVLWYNGCENILPPMEVLFMSNNKLIGAAVIGQSGGPSSVINASAYGVIKTALEADCITAVYGANHGIVAKAHMDAVH